MLVMQGGSTVKRHPLAHTGALPFVRMQPSVLSKGLDFSWRALRRASVNSTFCLWRALCMTTTNINLSTSVWTSPVGIESQFGQASHGRLSGKGGAIECKFSKDDEEILQKAIIYEAEHGFPNSVGRTKRFSEFLASKLFTLSNPNSSHSNKALISLFDVAHSYENMDVNSRVVLLDKVCALLGLKSVQDLLDQHHALVEASSGLKMNMGASEGSNNRYGDSLLMLQKCSHPAIVFGRSERIELFKFSENRDSPVGKLSSKDAIDFSSQTCPVAAETKTKSNLSTQKEKLSFNQGKKVRRRVKKVKTSDTYEEWLLNKPISSMDSLSSSSCSQLEENGFYTLRKLLQHYPRNYLNFLQARETIEDGQFLTFTGKILSSRGRSAHGLGILEIVIGMSEVPTGSENKDQSSLIFHLTRFFRGARYSSKWFLGKLVEKYQVGAYCAVSGKVKALDSKNHFEVKDYNLEVVMNSKDYKTDVLYPVYSSKGRLGARFFKLCIEKVLLDLPFNIDPLPEDYKDAHGLMDLRDAYIGIHSPETMEVAEKARQRFVFDEFFFLQLGLLLQRQALPCDAHCTVPEIEDLDGQPEAGYLPTEKWAPLTSRMFESLPYNLTNSQLKAVSEIIWDLQKPVPMRRLLQGDVGCGKTIVGFLAMLEVIDAGLQGVLMTPTEFLAKQHYERFIDILQHLDEKCRPQVALLTGLVPSVKAQAIRKGLETGKIQLAIGTHSLISENVRFASLGLAIIDEQHRFGVEQRLMLQNKGSLMLTGQEQNGEETVCMKRSPHILAMTATPIPRTLAYALYGDMDVTQITEVPPGRKPVKTIAFLGDEEGLSSTFEMIHQQLESGGRVFIVCAIIDESDSLPNIKSAVTEFERIEQQFPGYKCGLVHGKLKPNERDATMSAFKSGQIQVLVATSIVEVGIDIVEASMMVVMNAERFGMAQLHQLRGRVGRGTKESVCVLLAYSQNSLERMKLLESSNDGFHLAELDLQLRGPGDMLGRKQSGHLAEFSLACLSKDGDLMVQARKAAQDILQKYPRLEGLPKLKQELSFRQNRDSIGA